MLRRLQQPLHRHQARKALAKAVALAVAITAPLFALCQRGCPARHRTLIRRVPRIGNCRLHIVAACNGEQRAHQARSAGTGTRDDNCDSRRTSGSWARERPCTRVRA